MITPLDEKILEMLRQDCKISIKEMSRKIKVPMTTVHNRIKKMEREGVIRGYIVLVDHRKLGKNIRAIVQISVTYSGNIGNQVSQQEIAEKLYQMPEVESCYITTGRTDIYLQVVVSDLNQLNDYISTKLRTLPGVESATTCIVMRDMAEDLRKKYTGKAAIIGQEV